jgi:tetratricopeptide (TPR) repeat protein
MKNSSETFHRVGEAALLSCAVLLPLAFYFRTYDSAAIKHAVLIWGAVALGASWFWQGLARGRFAVSSSAWPALLPALLYGAWCAFSFAYSSYRTEALPWALNEAAMIAAYLAALIGFSGARFAARFAAFVVAAGWAVAGYALLQAEGVDPLQWKDAYGSGRAFSTLANPLVCAAFLSLLPPVALTLAQDPETAPPLRWACYALLPAAAAAAVATRSPWGLVGFAAVSAAYALFMPLASGTRTALRHAGLALAVAVFSAGAGAAKGDFSGEEFAQQARGQRLLGRGALAMAAANPLRGQGPGAFSSAFPRFRSPEHIRLEGHDGRHLPDSSLLAALAETGAVGAFLWAWLALGALWTGLSGAAALRRAGATAESLYAAGFTAAAAGALLASQFGSAWRYAAPGWLLWTLAGLGAGFAALAAKRAPVSAFPLPVSEDVRRALYVPSLLAAAVLAMPPGAWLKSEVDLNRAVFLARGGSLDEADALLAAVPRGAPGYALALYKAGALRLEQDKPEQALEAWDRLAAFAPEYPLLAGRRGEALAKLGRWEEAVAARRRQAALDPLFVPNLVAWAEAARAVGHLEEAWQAVELARLAAPEDPSVRMQVAANELYERRIAQGAGRRNPVTARRPRRP